MRGEQALYKQIFRRAPNTAGRIHQRNALLDQQDDLLASRYYYHAKLKKFTPCYEDCIEALSREFFLTTNTIIKRLTLRADYIKEMTVKGITTQKLRKRYPWMVW